MLETATHASSVRVQLGSKIYDSERDLQSQLYDPDSKTTIQEDNSQEMDLYSTSFDFGSDNEEEDKDNTPTGTSKHQTKLKERDISMQSKNTALIKQKIK